jgi:hypothetical protein
VIVNSVYDKDLHTHTMTRDCEQCVRQGLAHAHDNTHTILTFVIVNSVYDKDLHTHTM